MTNTMQKKIRMQKDGRIYFVNAIFAEEKGNVILSLFSVHVKCSQKKDNCGSTISQNIMYQIRVKR